MDEPSASWVGTGGGGANAASPYGSEAGTGAGAYAGAAAAGAAAYGAEAAFDSFESSAVSGSVGNTSDGCEGRTELVADPGTSCDTAYTCSGKHSGRVALVLVLLLLLLVGGMTRGSVIMTLVAMSVAEECALVMAAGRVVRRA